MREPIEDPGSSRSKRHAPQDPVAQSADREIAGRLNNSLRSLQAAGNTAVTELLGWLGSAVRELRARVGSVVPMTDKEIGTGIGEALEDVAAVSGRLK
ncbi:MAG TPA: hypothetical protein VEX41_09970 [Candidatus Eisenbacteria bacterium]|nr:hypothetical protein [Candidatus Eisenbacteria bacterium]